MGRSLLNDPFNQQFTSRIHALGFAIKQVGANGVLHLPAVIDLDAIRRADGNFVRGQKRLWPAIVAVKIDATAVPELIETAVMRGSGVAAARTGALIARVISRAVAGLGR